MNEETKTLLVPVVVAVVALAGFFFVFTAAPSGAPIVGIVQPSPGGSSYAGQLGWELGVEAALRWDNPPYMDQPTYCNYACGTMCSDVQARSGLFDVNECTKVCASRCDKELLLLRGITQ